MIRTKELELDTEGNFSVVNITDRVREFVASTGLREGQALIFYRHTTGAVYVGEHEPGILADIQEMFERVAPASHAYRHHLRAVDFNGHAHVRSALMTISVTVPVVDGELMLGTFQEILVVDDQTEPARRYVAVQVIGE